MFQNGEVNYIFYAMPLPNILSGKTLRCKAKSRRSKKRCKNPAAYGMSVCRYHGARKPETIKKGANHPQPGVEYRFSSIQTFR